MISASDIVEVALDNFEVGLAIEYAKAAEIGGSSNIRNSLQRAEMLSIDQFIGVGIGELVGNKFFFSLYDYVLSREAKNKTKDTGDGGCDTIGFRIDYKASKVTKKPLLGYNLPIRPKEIHENHIYVLIMVDTHGRSSPAEFLNARPPSVYIIGWATTEMVMGYPQEVSGIFGPVNGCGGARLIPATALNPARSLNRDMIPMVGS